MDIQFSTTPQMFGVFHIAALAVIALGCIGAFFLLRRMNEARLLRLIWILGAVMLLLEVWKQVFSWVYVYGRRINLWFFPWQLCSMAMYCAFAVRFVKGQRQNAALVFLSTFSFFAAIVALVIPSDMLRPYILLTVHGFLYHGLMIVLALAAMLTVHRREGVRFAPAVRLFFLHHALLRIHPAGAPRDRDGGGHPGGDRHLSDCHRPDQLRLLPCGEGSDEKPALTLRCSAPKNRGAFVSWKNCST